MRNLPISLINSTYEIKSCPLCNSKNSEFYKYFYKNRYTEEFSNLIGVKPDYLMRNVSQRLCIKCKLVFKRRWFKNCNDYMGCLWCLCMVINWCCIYIYWLCNGCCDHLDDNSFTIIFFELFGNAWYHVIISICIFYIWLCI